MEALDRWQVTVCGGTDIVLGSDRFERNSDPADESSESVGLER